MAKGIAQQPAIVLGCQHPAHGVFERQARLRAAAHRRGQRRNGIGAIRPAQQPQCLLPLTTRRQEPRPGKPVERDHQRMVNEIGR